MQRWLVALILAAVTSLEITAQDPPALIVEAVVTDSAAAKIGLAVGDRLLSYDARPLPSPAALQALEENTFDSPRVALQLRRGSEALTLTAPRGALGAAVRPTLAAETLALYEEGRRARTAPQTETAIARWSAAAGLARDDGDDRAAAWLFNLVGEAHQRERRWSEAFSAHQAAWALLEQSGDPSARSRTLTALGRCRENLNDLPGALQWYERALEVDTAAGYDAWMAADFTSLGLVAHTRGDLEAGQHYHERALAIRERITPDSLAVADSLNSLGNSHFRRGDLSAAENFYSRALAIRERLAPNSLAVAGSFNNLGNIANNRADLAAAHDFYRRAVAIQEREAPESLNVSISLANLGNLARVRGDFETAEQYLKRGLAIRERLVPGSLLLASSLNNLGLVAWARKEFAASHAFHTRALAIRERLAPDSLIVSESLDSLGDIARALGDPGASRGYYDRALAIQQRLSPSSLKLAETLDKLGALALDDQRFSDALVLFSRAIDIVEAQRSRIGSTESRALLLARHFEPYAGLLQAQLALDDVPAAFATAERSRSRSLLESLGEAKGEIRRGVDGVLLETERLLQRRINEGAERLGASRTPAEAARVRQELDGLLVQYRDLQAQIRTSSPRYAEWTRPQPLSLSGIQREVLDEGTLLLEYVLGAERSFLFAVTKTTIESVALPGRARIEQAARRVYDAIIARQPVAGETPVDRRARIARADAEYPAAAAALSRMILEPIAGHLSGPRILIVADGALQYVPFAALPRPGQPDTTAAEPLVVRHEIVSLPSASIVAVLRGERAARPAPERAVAVVADPVFDAGDSRLKKLQTGSHERSASSPLPADITRAARAAGLTDDRGTLARLPFSRAEADAIVALAAGGGATRAVDFLASRATLASRDVSRAGIVHLATHGLLDAERPELSGLVLSLFDERGRPQDGFLRLHDVYNLDWAADLVVLSACQTALGQEIRGEGLVGLTRGFMYGGAARVMASLWSVNDSATARLMTRFYEELLGNGLPPAEALRKAQVEMWRRPATRSPYYWAAFVLQGEWR